jgi:hypothetical protein
MLGCRNAATLPSWSRGKSNRFAIDRELKRHDASVNRKNGRVADKNLLSFPVELSVDHRYQAARRFMQRITFEGRSRAGAFFRDQDSPHAHIILLDRERDVETGESQRHGQAKMSAS